MTQMVAGRAGQIGASACVFVLATSCAFTDIGKPRFIVSQPDLPALHQLKNADEYQWNAYLTQLVAEDAFSEEHMRAVKEFRQVISNHMSASSAHRLPTQAGPTPDGALQLTWNSKEHYLEVDIQANGVFDWFYRNRNTGDYEGDENCSIRNPSQNIIRHIANIAS